MTQPTDQPVVQPVAEPVAPPVAQPVAEPVAGGPVASHNSEAGVVPDTGHPVVDEVLRSLDGLDSRGLEQQVQVLDAAHARLHAVLADAGDDSTT